MNEKECETFWVVEREIPEWHRVSLRNTSTSSWPSTTIWFVRISGPNGTKATSGASCPPIWLHLALGWESLWRKKETFLILPIKNTQIIDDSYNFCPFKLSKSISLGFVDTFLGRYKLNLVLCCRSCWLTNRGGAWTLANVFDRINDWLHTDKGRGYTWSFF